MSRPAPRVATAAAATLAAAALGAAAAAGAGDLPPLPGAAAGLGAGVEALGWVERDGSGAAALVVTLVPRGAARLVADPGVTATPVAAPGVTWVGTAPAGAADPSREYFDAPPLLRLPFEGSPAAVAATVGYAWCEAAAGRCLFGEASVAAAVPPPPAGG